MRIANSTIARNYTRNLGRSMVRLNDLGHKAETWTKFSTMAENTAGGVRAMELRRNIARLQTNMDNVSSSLSIIKEAESQLRNAHDITKQFHERIVQSLNDTNGPEERQAIVQELTRLRESMVSISNARFSDRYLFGGTVIDKPPFAYNGNVNPSKTKLDSAIADFAAEFSVTPPTGGEAPAIAAALADVQTEFAALSEPIDKAALETALAALDTAVGSITDPGESATYTALYNEVAKRVGQLTDTPKLLYHGEDVTTTLNPNSSSHDSAISDMLARSSYIDIGLGVRFDSNNNVDPSSVFKNSFNGLECFGTGSNNIVLMMDDLIAAISSDYFSHDSVGSKLDAFLQQAGKINEQVTRMGADTNYLDFTLDAMKAEEINLEERRKDVEALDPAKAIMDYELQHTAYSAALQMGQRVLMPTLWDYVK